MKNILSTTIVVTALLYALKSHAQMGNYHVGARSAALSNTHLSLLDEWALFNNIGALSYTDKKSVFASYRIPYGLTEIQSIAAGFSSPFLNGVTGIGIYRFGQDLFNEHKVNIGYSNRFGIVSLGVNVSYYQLAIQGGINRKTLVIDFGGHAQLTEKLSFAAHISNISQSKISKTTEEQLPSHMKMEISYRPSSSIILNLGIDKDLEYSERLSMGLEYMIIQNVYLRTGLETKPFQSSFGIGLKLTRILIDYAYRVHPVLGAIHETSLAYHLN